MRKFRKFLYSAVIAAAVVLVAVFLVFQQKRPQNNFMQSQAPNLHYAGDASKSIDKVKILAFYFVPSGAQNEADDGWGKILNGALESAKNFYQFQFKPSLSVNFEVYPSMVTGQKTRAEYDGASTAGGNPNALLSVRKELIDRALTPGGDLYQQNFASGSPGEYLVMAILYQGLGSSATLFVNSAGAAEDTQLIPLDDGGPPAMLISRYYFTGPSYQDYNLSVFAHEFGHTLGLPDAYDLKTGDPTSDDILGIGRFEPIGTGYLSSAAKKMLGY